jgi:hypothetical protein
MTRRQDVWTYHQAENLSPAMRGEFRLFWLDPGDYYIAITPPSPPRAIPRTRFGYFPSNPDEAFVTTYYPGTADSNQAERVRVGRGEVDVHAIKMATLAARHIRGRLVVAGLERGQLVSLRITMRPSRGQPYGSVIERQINQAFGDGVFELVTGAGVGSYQLAVRMLAIGGESYFGSVDIVVEGLETDIIEIPVTRTAALAPVSMRMANSKWKDCRRDNIRCWPSMTTTNSPRRFCAIQKRLSSMNGSANRFTSMLTKRRE